MTRPAIRPIIELMSSLADIIAQETQDGRLIVRFLLSAMDGDLPDFLPCHRIDATRLLVKLGFDQAQPVIDQARANRAAQRAAASPNANPDSHSQPQPKTQWLFESQSETETQSATNSIRSQLAQIVREETDDGRAPVRFLIEAMQGELPDFKPCHRLAAAKELLQRGFDYQPDDAPATPVIASAAWQSRSTNDAPATPVIASAAWQSRSGNDAPQGKPAAPTPEELEARRRAELIEFSKHGPRYYKNHPFPCVCEDRLHDCDGNVLDEEQRERTARRPPAMEYLLLDPDQMARFLVRYAEYLKHWNAEHPGNPIDINRFVCTNPTWRHLNNPARAP